MTDDDFARFRIKDGDGMESGSIFDPSRPLTPPGGWLREALWPGPRHESTQPMTWEDALRIVRWRSDSFIRGRSIGLLMGLIAGFMAGTLLC